jgi:NAD(P)-dependent dehydrogenase (short-subunit alcohol dehydrogenase family)
MQDPFRDRTAVITGGAAGIGAGIARAMAARGARLVLADVDEQALAATARQLEAEGAMVLPVRTDVGERAQVEALAEAAWKRFGGVHIVCNNAGVGVFGEIAQARHSDWEYTMRVNFWGVAHGVEVFAPRLIAQKAGGHIVNTASMAGLLNPPNMGVYNASKHAVVAMSETLYQDLQLVSDQITASVLCPFFVPTGITESQRNRPEALAADKPTRSQLIGKAMNDRAVGSGKVSAADVARFVFDAVAEKRFYIYSHPKSLASVQTRLEDIMQARNPTDPFAGKPEIGAELRAALRAER